MLKKISWSALIILFLLAIWKNELIWYGIKQGQGQLKIIRNVIEVEKVMQRVDFPDSLKLKIEVIQNTRKFAEELGLKDTDNYSTFYDQKGSAILWNVSASRSYSFKPKTWWFPVVGEVPYKGFFDLEKATQVGDELKKEGWDVRVYSVSGWSTLGWFKDPILSNMLNRSEGQLAELIIHELTHGTIFIKNKVTFNENLASFIGEQGAKQFLSENYGANSKELTDYLNAEEDSKKFTNHILLGTNKLDSLYQAFGENMEVSQKQHLKETLISSICERIDTIQFSNDRYKEIFSKTKPNNAYFMSFLRYYSASDSLSSVWKEQYDSNLKLLVKDFVERHGS